MSKAIKKNYKKIELGLRGTDKCLVGDTEAIQLLSQKQRFTGYIYNSKSWLAKGESINFSLFTVRFKDRLFIKINNINQKLNK